MTIRHVDPLRNSVWNVLSWRLCIYGQAGRWRHARKLWQMGALRKTDSRLMKIGFEAVQMFSLVLWVLHGVCVCVASCLECGTSPESPVPLDLRNVYLKLWGAFIL